MNVSINKYSKALSGVLSRDNSAEITSEQISNFLKIVAKKKKRKILKRFVPVFEKNWLEKNNEMHVVLHCAFDLEAEFEKTLSSFLEESLGRKIVFTKKIDKSIIGGIKLEFDEKVLDLSVRKNLEILKNKFLEN